MIEDEHQVHKNIAVIVEPRNHRGLQMVIRNIRNKLPSWPILLFHGTLNETAAKAISANTPNMTIRNCGHANFTSIEYSRFVTDESFWNSIPFENILLFQTDSIILGGNERNINKYLEYDYVGAPWRWSGKVGNGGFSFRHKSAMLAAIREAPITTKRHPEDLFFGNFFHTRKKKYRIPSFEVARSFSVESVFHPNPFGGHKCWKHMKGNNWKYLTRKYPELIMLRQLNKTDMKIHKRKK